MPMSKEDLEYQRAIDELRSVMRKLGVEPNEERGRVVMAQCLAAIAANGNWSDDDNARAAG
jgi:hypothetical protein